MFLLCINLKRNTRHNTVHLFLTYTYIKIVVTYPFSILHMKCRYSQTVLQNDLALVFNLQESTFLN